MKSIFLSLSLLASAAVGVIASDDLQIDVTLPVECDRTTRKGDQIQVHYSGTLKSNGEKFDSSYDRNSPFAFKLGAGMVIKGWDEGLLDMCIGEKRTLTIGPSYGYGDRNVGPIPAGSTLVFETELMGIDGVPKPESIVTKSATESATATPAQKVAEKVASVAKEAVKAAETMAHWLDEFADKHPRTRALLVHIRSWLPPLNFITIHYAYFIVVCLVASLIFWGSSDPALSISYVDSLFVVVSAMTEAGLNTVNLSQMTTWQQTLLFLLVILGSSIWVSIWTIAARKHAFEQRFQYVVRAERLRSANRGGSILSLPRFQRLLPFRRPLSATFSAQDPIETSHADDRVIQEAAVIPPSGIALEIVVETQATNITPPSHISFVDALRPATGIRNSAASTSAQPYSQESQPVRRNASTLDVPNDDEKGYFNMRHFLARRSAGRNAQFHDLTREEREHLGGCEYRALKVLSVIVPLYFFLWQLLGCLALGAWINNNHPGPPLANGINPWWLGIFNGASAFNNSGMSLLDANMIPFQNSYFVLITMGLLILAGNTAYPIFLRLIIWSLLKFLMVVTREDESSALKDTFRFILKYPRRVYTNLFPARATWWLLFMLVLLNSIDWVSFELLNLGNPAIERIPTGSRVLDGLFQALAVRHSNVYEERSLGIYNEDDVPHSDTEQGSQMTPVHGHNRPHHESMATTLGRAISHTFTWHGVGARPPSSHQNPESRISFISQQIHGQLAHDIWWLVLATLVIVTINTSNFMKDPVAFSVFNVIFEVVSAYGCVGISVGAPNDAYSFAGSWHGASKLVLCAVMIRGRHRGLPVALDRAVRLPGEELHEEEEEDHRIRRSMTNRRASD
ncbi:cation transport protein-domain-containing protein [Cladorrhinum samala]|uniref:Potassium transport protein n=1 Tax=Cladorrhinum samala TaxID=585594 RepID=A0AAV9HHA3_9PEZI|nr:cation transport protein-domain-containing protein [Cladorrhinum samala]